MTVVDPQSGQALRGVEDLAATRDGAWLLLSAYDRLAVETALSEARAPSPTTLAAAGLFWVRVADLDAGRAEATRALWRDETPGALLPHGLDLARVPEDGARLAVINRRFDPAHPEALTPEILVAALVAAETPGAPPRLALETRHRDPALCQANDVLWTGARLTVSLDVGHCGGVDILFSSGRALEIAPDGSQRLTAAGLAFANGLALAPGDLAVAETRGDRLRLVMSEREVALPGGPDNLTVTDDGRILAALHPSLIRLALYRFGWRARAPSRIVAVEPASGAVTVLYDDPGGALFSGATAALQVGERLIMGSVRDEGLLLCGGPALLQADTDRDGDDQRERRG